MRINELSVGDFVMFDGSPYVIEEVSEKGWAHIKDIKTGIRIPMTTDFIIGVIEGVPMSRRILRKNRFECHTKDSFYTCDSDGAAITVYYWGGRKMGKITLDPMFLLSVKGADFSVSFYVEYVHQLQHALRLLGLTKEVVL